MHLSVCWVVQLGSYISDACLRIYHFSHLLSVDAVYGMGSLRVMNKVKLFQHLPWRHVWRWGVPALIFSFGTGCTRLVSFTFTPEERGHGTYWIRNWSGHRAGVDTLEKREILWWSNPESCIIQPIVKTYQLHFPISVKGHVANLMSGCVRIYDCGNLSSCKVFWFPGQGKKFKLGQNVLSEWCIVLDILYTAEECYYRHSFESLPIECLSTCTAFWIMMKCTCVGFNQLWLLHERPESFIFVHNYL